MAGHAEGRRPNRAWVVFERAVLGFGMSLAAWVIERQLEKALKKGSVESAPRTAANTEASPQSVSVHPGAGPTV